MTLLEYHKRTNKSGSVYCFKVVNKELIQLYWDIGKTIVSRQVEDPDSWGKSVVKRLSLDLGAEFPESKGYSSRNIWRMRNLFLTYHKTEKLPPLVAQIPWTHNILIMEKCKNSLKREFYIRMTYKFNWSKQFLINQIVKGAYEKTLLNQTNFETTLPENILNRARISIKDEYTFDFLEMKDEHSERQLEQAIILNLPDFLREMGGNFAFIGNQYRLEVNEKEFFIDLLMFHRKLRRLIAIDLKTCEFKPEFVGKMQFYLTALEEIVKEDFENSPIGIILCKTKDRTIAEYTLRPSNVPIGVSKYTSVKKLPKDLKNQMPLPEQIERLLKDIE